MRTNVVLDDGLMDEAFKYAKVKTKREVVHLALQEFADRSKHVPSCCIHINHKAVPEDFKGHLDLGNVGTMIQIDESTDGPFTHIETPAKSHVAGPCLTHHIVKRKLGYD